MEEKKDEDEEDDSEYIPIFNRTSTSRMKPPLNKPSNSNSLPNKPVMQT